MLVLFRSIALLLAFSLPAAAAAPPCPGFFAGGQAPDLVNPKLAAETSLLCFQAFAVGYSGLTRTPLWSAELLTADGLDAARGLRRQGEFHPEERLPPDQSAELSDYARSGFDRGHMSPSGDMPTASAQDESFSLANMVPQAPMLNRGLWEGIESAVRTWTGRNGTLFVVTGPIFQGNDVQALHGRVLVPTLLFKAVYNPARNRAAAYLTRNTDDSGYEVISIDQLTRLAGIDVFPAVPAAVKMRAVNLPVPTPHRPGAPRPRRGGDTTLLGALSALLPKGATR